MSPRKKFQVTKKDVDEFLHRYSNLLERPTISKLAAELGVSAPTLRKRFREQYGISPASYMRSHRHKEAVRLLARDLKTSAVASASGFGSQRTLERRFAKEHGTSPGKFRKVIKRSQTDK